MDDGDKNSSNGDVEDEDGVLQELEATEASKDAPAWTIALADHELRGRSEAKRASFTITRDSLLAKLSIVDGFFAPRCVSVRNPKVVLRLQPDAFRALKDWVGQQLLLRGVLKQRLGWALPIGILFLIGSLPVEADVAEGIEAMPFDVFSAVLGGLLLVQGAASQKWPHHVFLVLDSAWFAALMVSSILDIVNGADMLWGLAIAMQLWLIYSGLRDWNLFRRGIY